MPLTEAEKETLDQALDSFVRAAFPVAEFPSLDLDVVKEGFETSRDWPICLIHYGAITEKGMESKTQEPLLDEFEVQIGFKQIFTSHGQMKVDFKFETIPRNPGGKAIVFDAFTMATRLKKMSKSNACLAHLRGVGLGKLGQGVVMSADYVSNNQLIKVGILSMTFSLLLTRTETVSDFFTEIADPEIIIET